MLVVRQEQFETIIKGTEEDFVNYLFVHVKGNYAEDISKRDDKTLREMIRGGIKKAEIYHLTAVEETKTFVSKMFEIAPNFDEQAEIRAVLDDQTISSDKRIEKLQSPFVTEENWEEAKNNYDESAWFPERKKSSGNRAKNK